MSLVLYTFRNGQSTIQKETRQRGKHEFWSLWWRRSKRKGLRRVGQAGYSYSTAKAVAKRPSKNNGKWRKEWKGFVALVLIEM